MMSFIHPLIAEAYSVLEGKAITRELALALAREIHGNDLLDLVSLAHKVTDKFSEPLKACSILNAKSGVCSQNCRFCAQSGHYDTPAESYPLLSLEKVMQAAQAVYDSGVRTFGYVTSGYGYLEPNEEFRTILSHLDALHAAFPDMKLCVSLGILSRETAKLLVEHHADRYNMNLQTNPARYRELIATTHNIEDKIQTIKYLKEAGMENCTGGILGLGESWEDRIDMAIAVRELGVEGMPLNVLLPIPGTPVEHVPPLSAADAAKAFAIIRLINPSMQIKFAAGRETRMKDFQGLLMLSGLNALMTGGYLTTRGRSVEEDEKFMTELKNFSTRTQEA